MQKTENSKIVPIAVQRLRLCSAMEECGAKSVLECLKETNSKETYVYDDADLSYTDWSKSNEEDIEKALTVLNPNGESIVLLPLDHRIITGKSFVKGGIADCALLTNKNMSFVEFKTNVESKNDKTIEQRTNEAICQLIHTYDVVKDRCKTKGVDIDNLVRIDFNVVFNKELNVTSAKASLQDRMMEFFEKYGKPLFFDNEKEFLGGEWNVVKNK